MFFFSWSTHIDSLAVAAASGNVVFPYGGFAERLCSRSRTLAVRVADAGTNAPARDHRRFRFRFFFFWNSFSSFSFILFLFLLCEGS